LYTLNTTCIYRTSIEIGAGLKYGLVHSIIPEHYPIQRLETSINLY